MKKKILLTGANGFFGTRFIKRYQHQYDVVGTDVPELDITDMAMLQKRFDEERPDIVIHAAAIALTDFCNKNPELAHKVNVQGAVNVATACKEVGAKLVFISTEQIFNGNTEAGPYTELDTPVPDTIYGKNKLEAEGILSEMMDELWILRFTWQFGLPERNTNINANVLWNAMQGLIAGEKMQERTNEFRGLTYIHELVDQFEKIFEIPYGIYHTGAKNDASRYDIAKHIFTLLGQEHRLHDILEAVEAPHTRDVRLDTSKLAQHGVSFTESTEAITRCLQEFKYI